MEVWEEVIDLTPPPSNDGHWEQSKEDVLAKFQNNERHNIERTYIMRRAERRKKGEAIYPDIKTRIQKCCPSDCMCNT